MDQRKFQFYNKLTATAVFIIATLTYLFTIEPTASFWDCGEFIASSYKLEVGHPPGNPVFQLFAHFFTIFADKMHAAAVINSLSAICSSFTILLLYLTIVFFSRRLISRDQMNVYKAVMIYVSGATGSLAFCFSDTFWFSAVEAEVYAMSSLFTALVFWAMTKWYEQADSPYANRWIVLICFLMGLSIGVHLLNLLSIPAIVFMYFYKIKESEKYSFKELVGIFILSCMILALLLFVIIPYIPKLAAYVDLFFVNILNLPFNSGAALFMICLFAGCFYGLFHTMKKGAVLANTILLCMTTVLIGFSVFSIVVIRSSAKTPTNEYQPDNPFTLVRYLNREQYGSKPLIYGEYFGSPYELKQSTYHAPHKGRYIKTPGIPEISFSKEGKMFFPRMWDNRNDSYVDFYRSYIGEDGIKVKGSNELKPTFMQNLTFFIDYQVNWMYWRYFMWNFAGRQNDLHSPVPGDPIKGNWECGIKAIDRMHHGDHSDAPDYLQNNKSKNHYYMLPLLLGIIGLVFQAGRDKRGWWLNFLMFFMTGIAIVIYLNQSPYQVRERDYAYAGSFYFFSLWIGLSAVAVYSWISGLKKNNASYERAAVAVSCLLLGVPALMASENWDDHDRSNRYTAVEMAKNYLNSTGKNGILVTHGDDDTFPLWYAQEVEEIRTDVRIVNTSLLGTDWHYDQMKYAVNQSPPLSLAVESEQYLYGTNDLIIIYDTHGKEFPLRDVMKVFRHPDAKIRFSNGKESDYIASRKLVIPVNKTNVLKHGILDIDYADLIPDHITLTIPEDKEYITKTELFFLDLLSDYQWDRPVNFLSCGGDINIGIKDYLMYDGFSYRFVPIKSKTTIDRNGFTDPEDIYKKITKTYSWDSLKRQDWHVDYHNLYTFAGTLNQRKIFTDAAEAQLKAGRKDRAVELLDMAQECIPEENFPLDLTAYGFSNEIYSISLIKKYYEAGCNEKAADIAERMAESLLKSAGYFMQHYDWAYEEFDRCFNYLSFIADLSHEYGDKSLSDNIVERFNRLIEPLTSQTH